LSSDFLFVQMLASMMNFCDPSHVFSGGMPRVGSLSLAAARQSVYHGSLALLTSDQDIQYSPRGECAAALTVACRLAMPVSLALRGGAQ
jgi:hypothetical protein